MKKLFAKKRNIKGSEVGFTLVELLLYVAVSSIIISVLSGFLIIMLQARVKNQTISEVEQQGDMVMRLITQTLQNATSTASPTIGTASSSLVLNVLDSTKNPTTFSNVGGVLQVQEGPNNYQQISFVQGNVDSASNPVVLPSPVADNDLIVVGITTNNQAISANAITDNYGNTYTEVVEAINGLKHAAIFYAKNVAGGAGFTVSSNINNRSLAVHEYSGADMENPLDLFASNTGNSKNPDSGNITTAADGELYFGTAWGGRDGDAWTAGAGYTIREQVTNGVLPIMRIATEDKAGLAQTTSASFVTTRGNPWAAAIATFKPASSIFSLTNDRVTASGLNFNNLSRAGTSGTVRVQFTLDAVNPGGGSEYSFGKTFYGSMSIH